MAEEYRTLEMRSTVTGSGRLEVALAEADLGQPGAGEVVVRMEAAPINPSDLALLWAAADMGALEAGGDSGRPTLSAPIPAAAMRGLAGRVDQAMPVGNEGAGTVVAAGPGAEHLMGRKVGLWGGGMYTRYRRLPARGCAALPDGAAAADGASMFVNPMTALGFVETMREQGHTAIVHTAAASNLGQMLNRICLADGIPLVNIVRRPEQAALLRDQGAAHVVDMSAPDFEAALTQALADTGATIAFDAIGGGKQASRILSAMEAVAVRGMTTYNRYGSDVHKQVYVYGLLDTGPTVLDRWVGFAWSVGGWLLTPFLQRIEPAGVQRLQARVLAELTTTFASRYTRTIGLAEALDPDVARAYTRKATGEKYLIDPSC